MSARSFALTMMVMSTMLPIRTSPPLSVTSVLASKVLELCSLILCKVPIRPSAATASEKCRTISRGSVPPCISTSKPVSSGGVVS